MKCIQCDCILDDEEAVRKNEHDVFTDTCTDCLMFGGDNIIEDDAWRFTTYSDDIFYDTLILDDEQEE